MKHTKMVRKACAAAVMAACASGAMAFEFETESGWTGSLNTTVSVGAAWRAEGIDKGVYAAENAVQNGLFVGTGAFSTWSAQARAQGWANGGKNQAGKYNYDKGDMFSNTYKVVSDLNFKKDNIAGLVRVKAWYDQALNNDNVPWGSQAAGMSAWNVANPQGSVGSKFNQPLSDSGAQKLSKFDGVYLLDAYLSMDFDMGNKPVQVRAGRQAINWGESIFIQGINQISPIDVNSARRAGSELKEAFLPVWALQASVGLGDGMSLEGFYQLKHEATAIEACGTYWSGNVGLTDQVGKCNQYSSFLPGAPGNAPQLPFGLLAKNLLLGPLVNLGATLSPLLTPAYTAGLTPVLGAALGSAVASQIATNVVGAAAQGVADGYMAADVNSSLRFQDNPSEPKNSGQWGIAFRMPVDALDAELGLYAMNIHSRLPALVANVKAAGPQVTSGIAAAVGAATPITAAQLVALGVPAAASAATAAAINARITPTLAGTAPVLAGALTPQFGNVGTFGTLATKTYFEYPEDMKIYGATLSGTVQGISYGLELSRQENIPVNRSSGDNYGLFTFANPGYGLVPTAQSQTLKADAASGKLAVGKPYNLYERFNKWQFQANAVASLSEFPKMIGAISGTLIGEVAFESNNVPDYKQPGVIRYGRADMFGFSSFTDPAAAANQNTCAAGTVATLNRGPGCVADGFVTDFSWGYRLRLAVDYPDFMGTGFVASPSIFWAHDVEGVSMTGAFSEGNTVLSLGLKLNLNKVHDINMAYTKYSGPWNTARDQDNYSVSYSYSF